ncbi:MAG: class I SAM-dependent methyltransferase [Acidimicrobiales bacterium]
MSDDPLRARRYDGWFESTWGQFAFNAEWTLVRSALGVAEGAHVLDVGCGTGRFARALEEVGAIVVGLDRDPAMLAVARSRVSGDLLVGDAHHLPFADRSFDAALAVTVCEFTGDPALVVTEMARVVGEGGRVVVGSLNPRSLWGLDHRRELRDEPWASARFLSRGDLRQMGAPWGMTTVRSALYSSPVLVGHRSVAESVEKLGRALPALGAFQVLRIVTPSPTQH